MGEAATHKRWAVLVVEDDAGTRRYIADCVEACPHLLLLASLGSVAEVRGWMGGTREAPDVLLTDLGLPDGSGVQVIREVLQRFSACEALVISMFNDDEHVLASIDAGALGYVQKDASPPDVVETILQLRSGESPMSPGIARRLLMRYRRDRSAAGHAASPSPGATGVSLSPREIEILDYLARGFSYAEIARLCSLTRNTVASHVKNLYRKMQVGSRSEAVFEGLQSGLIRPLGIR